MTKGIKFSDGAVLAGTVCLMGAPIVLGEQLNHALGQMLFYGGLGVLIMFVGWKLFGGSSAAELADRGTGQIINTGAFIGGDNSGNQQIFHGPVTITSPDTAPKEPSRELLPHTLTVERLMENFKDRTELRGKALCKPFIGKWMRVSGRVRSVSDYFGDEFCVSIRPEGNDVSIVCIFNKRWEAALHSLAPDDPITIVGILHSVSPMGMALDNCEIE